MNTKFTSRVISALLAIVICLPTYADTITGKITFVKRPPFTGILYVVDGGKASQSPTIDQKDKAFTTAIAVGHPGDTITFSNSDSFEHNIYASDKKQKVKFDVGLMSPNNKTEMQMDWNNNTLVRIGCKIHPKMRGYIANIDSSVYHAFEFERKVKEYDIKIDNVPADKTALELMLPKYPNNQIELKKGETKTIDIKRKGKVKATLTLTRS